MNVSSGREFRGDQEWGIDINGEKGMEERVVAGKSVPGFPD